MPISSPGWVILSPHLDDAVLSLGGQIAARARRGESVLVVTIFAGDPPLGPLSWLARRLHRTWSKADALMALRRLEDRKACRSVGADLLHWHLPDAIYRRSAITGRHLYPTLRALTGTPSPEDEELAAQVAERLAELPEGGELLVPLGVGSHVDHLLVRRAAEACFGPERLTYYEDYPYVETRHALERALGSADAWCPTEMPVEEADARAKTEAVLTHRSQMRSLFHGSLLARFRLWRLWRRTGVERTWTRRPGGAAGVPGSKSATG